MVRRFPNFEIEKLVNDVAAFEPNIFVGKMVWRTFLLLIKFAQQQPTAQNFRQPQTTFSTGRPLHLMQHFLLRPLLFVSHRIVFDCRSRPAAIGLADEFMALNRNGF